MLTVCCLKNNSNYYKLILIWVLFMLLFNRLKMSMEILWDPIKKLVNHTSIGAHKWLHPKILVSHGLCVSRVTLHSPWYLFFIYLFMLHCLILNHHYYYYYYADKYMQWVLLR